MIVLFLLHEHVVSYNHTGGGAARFAMFLDCLADSGYQIDVVRCFSSQSRQSDVLDWEKSNDAVYIQKIKEKTHSWTEHVYELTPDHPFKGVDRYLRAAFSPIEYYLRIRGDLSLAVKLYIDRIKPDIIWAEHVTMSAVVTYLNPAIPWVSSHHDWLFKLRKLNKEKKNSNWRNRVKYEWETWLLKRVELRIVKFAKAVISGSKGEASEISAWGKAFVFLIPTCFDLPAPNLPYDMTNPYLQIIHLGGMGTTANRIGLERYFEIVHPKLANIELNQKIPLILTLIGDIAKAPEKVKQQLLSNEVRSLGYVRDLSSVIRDYDIAIIPYEYNTGTRTRIALLFAHRLVTVAVKESVKGFPALEDGKNIVLVDSLHQMVEAIQLIWKDLDRRKKIGDAAYTTFEKHFTWQSKVNDVKDVLGYLQSKK